MNKDKQIDEALRIFQEECAEVIQAVSKIFRFGKNCHWPEDNISNLEQLEMEIGDVLCMIDILQSKGYIDEEKVLEYAERKRQRLKVWSNIDPFSEF